MTDNYMTDPTVLKYYEQWAKLPTLFTRHYLDDRRFYRFVKACIEYGRSTGEELMKVLTTNYLREKLRDSMHAQLEINEFVYLTEIDKIILRFEDIVWYEATPLD
jgi:hypothetical protein